MEGGGWRVEGGGCTVQGGGGNGFRVVVLGHGGQGFGIRIPGFGSKVLKVEVSGARLACGRQASQACTDCTFDVGINVRFGVNVFFCACVCVCVCVCLCVCFRSGHSVIGSVAGSVLERARLIKHFLETAGAVNP